MKQGYLESIPNFPIKIYDVKEKSGSRREYSLELSQELKDVASHISDVPLRFASLVLAYPSMQGDGTDQEFHSDSNSGERAIIYLTDVNEESNGPIEFEQYGKLLGKAGTYIHYPADEVHRGCKSDIYRYALALAFDDNVLKEITTIGAPTTDCADYVCPTGYKLKDPAPENIELTYQNCCNQTEYNTLLIISIIFVSLFGLFVAMYWGKMKRLSD